MRRAARMYGAIFRTQLAHVSSYPLDLLGGALTIVVFMWVFLHLWRAVFGAAGATALEGLTLADTLWYLVLAETIVLSKPRLAAEIARTVRDGSVAYLLARPYGFVAYHAATGLADAVSRAALTFAAGAALVWVLVGPPPSALGWPVAAVAVTLGWSIDLALSGLIGLAAFVTEDTSAIEWIYNKAVLILGGVLIPLDFLPDALGAAARRLPFAYAVWAPARLFVDPAPARFAALVGAQVAWLAVLALAVALAWRAAARRLAVNGG